MAAQASALSNPDLSKGPTVEDWLRNAAALFALLYGVGFLIVSLYDAQYGIAQFNPFRARVFLVGFLFTVLVALPSAAAHYQWSYFEPLSVVFENKTPELAKYKELFIIGAFPFTAALIAGAMSFWIMVPEQVPKIHPSWWRVAGELSIALGSLLLAALGYAFAGRRFAAKAKQSCIISLACGALICIFYSSTFGYGQLVFWFVLVAIAVSGISSTKDKAKYFLDYRNWISIAFILWIYSSQIYGHIKPRVGGGATSDVRIYLDQPVAYLGAKEIDAQLIDETEDGFYVLTDGQRKALLIPRQRVASVYFGHDIPAKTP